MGLNNDQLKETHTNPEDDVSFSCFRYLILWFSVFDGPFYGTLDKFPSPFTLSGQSTLSKENLVLFLTFLIHCRNQGILFLAMHS